MIRALNLRKLNSTWCELKALIVNGSVTAIEFSAAVGVTALYTAS